MEKLLRIGFAILLACWVVAPERVAAQLNTPRFQTVKAELAAEHPAEKLWQEVKTWIDPSIGFPVYAEKTVKETGAVKEFTYFGLRHDEGAWSAHQIEVKTRGQAGSTLLIIDRGRAKANLSIADFNPAQLTRF